MHAIQIDRQGGPEVLTLRELPDPEPGPGQVLVRVEAASVNWSDVARRSGAPYPFPTPLPFVPGAEVGGTVAGLGPGVDGPPVGTRVFALTGGDGSSGYAQHALADAPMVAPVPDGLGVDEAAGLVVAGTTAVLLLREAGRLAVGETVVVTGAGGGVGTLAVQLARVFGAGTVIGVASTPARRALAEELGADVVIDRLGPWQDEVRRVTGGIGADVVLECGGGGGLGQGVAALAPFGRLVVLGAAGGTTGALGADQQRTMLYDPAPNQSIVAFNLGMWFGLRPQAAGEALGTVVGLVASGAIRVRIGDRLSLAEAAEAHRRLEAGTTVGKLVLDPWA